MINWEEWNDEKLKADQRYKLIFIRRFGEEESEFMEKGVFGRKGIETLTSRYIPVKVDVDERPDVFIRYGFGATPSVSITTQDGRTLGGGTLCDYESFIKFMIELGTLITREKEIIEKYGAEELEEDEEPENDIDISEIRLQDLANPISAGNNLSLPFTFLPVANQIILLAALEIISFKIRSNLFSSFLCLYSLFCLYFLFSL